jgi:TetR/AcrR family transcriptional repressor of nem operon
MPWVKSFDEEVAVEKAMNVFWEKGFETASIADLLKGTGLNKGSLYNAFGGKRQLFVKALLKYDQRRQAILARMEAMDDPCTAIASFFDEIVATTVADQEHKGCFIFNTSLEICTHDDEVNEIVTNGVREIEAFFRRSIEVGQARDEIPRALQPEPTAKTLLALIVAIRVLGRGVFQESALHTIADQGKRLIAFSA